MGGKVARVWGWDAWMLACLDVHTGTQLRTLHNRRSSLLNTSMQHKIPQELLLFDAAVSSWEAPWGVMYDASGKLLL